MDLVTTTRVKVYYNCKDKYSEPTSTDEVILRRFRLENTVRHDLNLVKQKIHNMGKLSCSLEDMHLSVRNMDTNNWMVVNMQHDWEMAVLLNESVMAKTAESDQQCVGQSVLLLHIRCEIDPTSSSTSFSSKTTTSSIPLVSKLWSGIEYIRKGSAKNLLSLRTSNQVEPIESTVSTTSKETNTDNNDTTNSEKKQKQQDKLRVMTFNIRIDTPDDGINRWQFRSQGVCERLVSYNLDILCLQEALENQERDIFEAMNRDGKYRALSKGREYDEKTGKFYGEATSVIYNCERFDELGHGFFWLSDTPDKPGSKGWDAACVRIVTWCILKHRDGTDEKPFLLINTHLDYLGIVSRLNSVKLIKKRIFEILEHKDLISSVDRVIMTADFNCTSDTHEFMEMLKPMSSKTFKLDFCNTRDPEETLATYTGWNDEASIVIDYILLSDQSRSPYQVEYQVITDELPESTSSQQRLQHRKLSDHRPVLVTFF